MTEIEWADSTVTAGANEKYRPLLATIRGEQLASTRHREKWAVLESFTADQSGRDLAYRLKADNPDFEFISRKDGDKVTVYARLREGVIE